ncbi:MAG: peptide chain release factor N(5)-glutamine methyltransferase [Pseudomonadota bacterium]
MSAGSETRAYLILAASVALKRAGVEDPGRESRLLMRWVSGLSGAGLAAAEHDICPEDQHHRFAMGLARRIAREPLSHITGRRAFWSREFRVTPDVLDPRPETESLLAEALHRGPFGRVLDLGTGSGCLIISLLAEWPQATGTATDISGRALDVAAQNAKIHGVTPRLDLVKTDWIEGLEGPFDLIVSNPPYIREDEMPHLSPEVRDHEPALALSPGGDGLAAYRAISASIHGVLGPGGLLMVEIGATQSMEVSAILANAGWSVRAVIPDLDQRPRVIVAQA